MSCNLIYPSFLIEMETCECGEDGGVAERRDKVSRMEKCVVPFFLAGFYEHPLKNKRIC